MLARGFGLLLVAAAVAAGSAGVFGQAADNQTSIVGKPSDERDRPLGLREQLERMRIAREKKEYDDMIGRGQAALKISEELEAAFTQNGRLSDREITKLEAMEKLVKKIREELGGDGDEEDEAKALAAKQVQPSEAVKSFRSSTMQLINELRKTTRFTISAAAIETSNAVIRLARFLRIAR